MNLFENLQLMKENKNMSIILDIGYVSDEEIKKNIELGKQKYKVDLQYDNKSNNSNYVIVTGSPENVKSWIVNVYGNWEVIIGSEENADTSYWYDFKNQYFNYYPNAEEIDFYNYATDDVSEMFVEDIKEVNSNSNKIYKYKISCKFDSEYASSKTREIEDVYEIEEDITTFYDKNKIIDSCKNYLKKWHPNINIKDITFDEYADPFYVEVTTINEVSNYEDLLDDALYAVLTEDIIGITVTGTYSWTERYGGFGEYSSYHERSGVEKTTEFVPYDDTCIIEDSIKYNVDSSIKIEDFDIEDTEQEFTSAKTSINSSKLPAIFKMINLQPNTINLDFGGGKFDNVAEFLIDNKVINLVYDPYNRSAEHNLEVINKIRENGGADSVTCSNVLNVIKEPEARLTVLKNIYNLAKSGAPIYITVYEGSGKGDSKVTKAGYQVNQPTKFYLDEIKQIFPNATIKGKLISATK